MNRREFAKQFGLSTAALTLTGTQKLWSEPTRKAKPNIVVILSDDVGYGDLSCYGGINIATPNIDALAQQGVRFTDAHADAATCTPSRYAMLTGQYAWRRDGIQVLPGDAKSLIEPGRATIASVLKSAGYATGLVGKWHLGLGEGAIDWNGRIAPGPCEVGFDDAFYFAATADRVPTVYIHNHTVVNLDPADPITVSYSRKVGDEPTGHDDPELLKMKLSEGHDGTIVDGISRIGFMTGGKAARWTDETMAKTFTDKACEFIQAHKDHPFLLYFTPSDIHVPHAPAAQFADKSECGIRCDTILQLDDCVGRVMQTLKEHNLLEDTLVLFTSDNGPVVNDGYNDNSVATLGAHRPAGQWRGGKYSVYEGGTRVPLITCWQGRIGHGVSNALVSQVDLLRSLASLVDARVPAGQAQDSQDELPVLLGRSQRGRESLIEEALFLSVRTDRWKLVDRRQRPGEHPGPAWKAPTPESMRVAKAQEDRFMPGSVDYPEAEIELYDILVDPGETHNVAAQHPEIVAKLRGLIAAARRAS
ncbi:MAG: arylsulfatase [Acidobacteriota bacterium]|nr:arylsulfatase [Acidobacteriota bacterium]